MNSSSQFITIFKAFCATMVVISGVLAAWFELLNRAKTKEEHGRLKHWYEQKWQSINRTGLLELPEIVVKWFLGSKIYFDKLVEKFYAKVQESIKIFIFISTIIVGLVLIWEEFGFMIFLGGILIIIPSLLFYILVLKMDGPTMAESLTKFFGLAIGFLLILSFVNVIWLFLFYVLLQKIIMLPITYALLVTSLVLPMLAIYMTIPFELLGLGIFGKMGMVQLTITASLFMTLFSLTIGHYAAPGEWVPQTIRMYLANILCDGLTVFATFKILKLAVRAKKRIPIPVAVIIDVIVAAVLAVASLWLGLVGTDNSLSLTQIINILIGRSADGASLGFGPLFFVMHTTFLPTIFYLSVILLCWLAKLVVLPIAKVLSKGQDIDQPHQLTAGVFLLISSVFGSILIILNFS